MSADATQRRRDVGVPEALASCSRNGELYRCHSAIPHGRKSSAQEHYSLIGTVTVTLNTLGFARSARDGDGYVVAPWADKAAA